MKITAKDILAYVRCTKCDHEEEVFIKQVTASHGETIEGYVYAILEDKGWGIEYDHNAQVVACKCPACYPQHFAEDRSED